MIDQAKDHSLFPILVSLNEVGELLASLFIAEVIDLNRFSHYKEVEKYAGLNLNLKQSGKYVGPRHISKLGNKRLSFILYRMTEGAVKSIPEVRIKYLKRTIKSNIHRKNVVAATSWLLKLIFALHRENQIYEAREEAIRRVIELED